MRCQLPLFQHGRHRICLSGQRQANTIKRCYHNVQPFTTASEGAHKSREEDDGSGQHHEVNREYHNHITLPTNNLGRWSSRSPFLPTSRQEGSSHDTTIDAGSEQEEDRIHHDIGRISTTRLNEQQEPTENAVDSTTLQEEEREILSNEQDQEIPKGEHRNRAFKGTDARERIYSYTLGHAARINMVHTLRKVRELGLPDYIESSGKDEESPASPDFKRLSFKRLQLANQHLVKRAKIRTAKPEFQRLWKERRKLPIHGPYIMPQLKKLINTNDVAILVSETGSGKTTQLPQLILDWKTTAGHGAKCNIICTQPRRLAAISIARRVAQEHATTIGEEVGYSVRFARHLPRALGSIGYWTAGVLLKSLYDEPELTMTKYSHLIIDEVHERDVTTDLVLTALRDLIRKRRQAKQFCPKIILMSATIEALDFERYFTEPFPGGSIKVDSLQIPGRSHGITDHMLDDYATDFEQHSGDGRFVTLLSSDRGYLTAEDKFADSWNSGSEDTIAQGVGQVDNVQRSELQDVPIDLVAATIAHALTTSDHGDVLVFLPGIREIDRVQAILDGPPIVGLDFNDREKLRIYKLHASLWETNDQVFENIPKGCRRVVLSTNIAQTSITLPDVVHVIDAGQQRRMGYNPATRVNEFRCHWIDKSTSKQRKGRTGRTQPGHYWTLFTRARYESMRARPPPEIQSLDLTTHCLAIKAQIGAQGLIKDALARCLDPPDISFVDPAVEELKKLRMLDENENITPLGRFAAWFPLPPATARALLLGILFRCLEPLLIMASHNNDKPLIQHPRSLKSQLESAVHFAGVADDDRAAYVAAFKAYNSAFLSKSSDELAELEEQNVKHNSYREMLNVSRQICDLLVSHRVLSLDESENDESVFSQLPAYLNENASSEAFTRCLALAMQHSSMGVYHQKDRIFYSRDTRVAVRPFSVNAKEALRLADRNIVTQDGKLLSYSLLLTVPGDNKPTMSETSNITPLMAMLFGGSIEVIDKNTIQINGWLKYRVHCQNEHDKAVLDDGSAIELIFEFRKTLDRFIQIACMDLRSTFYSRSGDRGVQQTEQLISPVAAGNRLTEAFANGLKAVIESDAALWDEYVLAADEVHTKRKPKAIS